MKKTIKLTENDLLRLVKRVVKEQEDEDGDVRLSWDDESQFNRKKKAWSNFLFSSKSEEELMERVLNLAEFATHRKQFPFK